MQHLWKKYIRTSFDKISINQKNKSEQIIAPLEPIESTVNKVESVVTNEKRSTVAEVKITDYSTASSKAPLTPPPLQLLVSFYDFLVFIENVNNYKIISQDKFFFGIAYSKDKIYVSSRTEISIYTNKLNHIKTIKLKKNNIADVHQLVFFDNKLYIANTENNHINVSNENLENILCLLNKLPQFTNSIFIKNKDEIITVHKNAHGSGKSSIVCSDIKNKQSKELCATKVSEHWHNCFIEDNDILFLSSNTGEVVKKNLLSGVEKRIKVVDVCGIEKTHTWVRGLSVTADYVIVGCCINGSRTQRHTGFSYILFFDREMNFLFNWKFPFGGTSEIRCLSEYDYAHGSNFGGVIK